MRNGGVVLTSALPIGQRTYALTNDDAGSLSPPTTIGPFRVLHQVGAGVLGPVFRAHDGSGTEVAVKLFRIDLTPEQASELASVLDALSGQLPSHPGIVRCVAAGLLGATAWMAAEYVGADALDARIRRRTGGGLKQILPVLGQVAEALDVASSVGIHHGALHPRDILLSTTGDVHVTGLGVADALRAVGGPPVIRRPYAAPELVASPQHRADAAADLFSLGAMAVELLTGRRPLGVGAAAANLVSGVADGVDADRCRAALARALAESPSDRFATAVAFVAALARAVEDPSFRWRQLGVSQAADSHEAAVVPTEAEAPPTVAGQPEGYASASGGEILGREREEAGAPKADEPVMQRGGGDALDQEASFQEPVRPTSPPEDLAATPSPAAALFELSLHAPRGSESLPPSVDANPESAATPEPEDVQVDGAPAPPLEESVAHEDPAALEALAHFDSETDRGAAARRTPASERSQRDNSEWVSPGLFELATARGGPESGPEPPGPAIEPEPVAAPPAGPHRSRILVPLASLAAGVVLGVTAGYLLWGQAVAPRQQAVMVTEGRVASAPEEATTSAASSTTGSGATPRPDTSLGTVAGKATPPTSGPPAEAAGARPAAPVPAGPVRQGRLVVRSTPTGARVTVNGQPRGVTPVALDALTFGSYEVGLTRTGYRTEVRRVSLSQEHPVAALSLTLRSAAPEARQTRPAAAARAAQTSKAPGSLDVLSRPAGASVYIDGRLVGTTPYHATNLTPGRRSVRLVLEGYGPWATTVDVEAGGTRRVAASLELTSR